MFKLVKSILWRGAIASLLFFTTISCSFVAEKTDNKNLSEKSFYDICFYPKKLPKNVTERDLNIASDIFMNYFSKSINFSANNITKKRICFFTNKIPKTENIKWKSDNGTAFYLLTAFFNKDYESIYKINKNSIKKIYDKIPLKMKSNIIKATQKQGINIKGTDSLIIYFKNYIESIGIPFKFGITKDFQFYINVPPQTPFLNILDLLWENFNFKSSVSPRPGDYAFIYFASSKAKKSTVNFVLKNWKKTEVKTFKSKYPTIKINKSLLNTPFSEDILLRYLYSLKNSYKTINSPAVFYSPQFKGINVEIELLLKHSKIIFKETNPVTIEHLFMWILNSKPNDSELSDTFFANLLTLKIVKKLYTGIPQFLGGAELVNITNSIPWENISKTLFSKNNIEISKNLNTKFYLNFDEKFQEQTTILPKKEAKSFKAFFGAKKGSEYLIASIVLRSKNFQSKAKQMEKIISENGFSIIQKLKEQIEKNDGWASISIILSLKEEEKLLKLFNSTLKPIDKSISIGVYRVKKEK